MDRIPEVIVTPIAPGNADAIEEIRQLSNKRDTDYRTISSPLNWIIELMSVVNTITASVTQTQGQQALLYGISEISVCGNTDDVVTLPSAIIHQTCLLINNGAETLQVYPADGDDLGAGADTSTTITSGNCAKLISYKDGFWVVAATS